LDNGNFDQFMTPLNPMRFQSQLGKEMKRRYKEGQNVVRLSLARVTKVNYQYNTVDVQTTRYKNTFSKNPVDNGRYAARLPVAFGGKTPEGNVYGSNTLVTVGSLVLIGFMEGSKDHPIVLNIYGDTDNQSQLTRTSFSSADESDESVQRELWQLFNLYPSMTYSNIDGNGNKEVTFSGKTFMYITDTDPDNEYVNDAEFDYDLLPSSRYANGELIEPKSATAPTLLYVHQGVYDKHRVTLFIKGDGTMRIGSRHTEGEGITYYEMRPDGGFEITQKADTTNPEEESSKYSSMGITKAGNVYLKSRDHLFELTEEGVLVDGKPLSTFGGGIGDGDGGTIILDDLIDDLESVKTTITIINGKIESTISREEYDIDMEEVREYAEKLIEATNEDIKDVNDLIEDLDGYIDGAFYDGIIEESEAKTIATYINNLRTEKADVDARYVEILGNVYLPKANDDILVAAKTKYDTEFTDLIDIINAAIMDSKASEEDKVAVDAAFASYQTAVAELSAAFLKAADAIALAQAKEAEDVAYRHTESRFTQLSDEISSRVSSKEFTTEIGNIESKFSDMEENIADRIKDTNDKIDEVEKNVVYKAEIISSNGNIFRNQNVNTILFCRVYRGDQDITETIEANRFRWSRVSDDAEGDEAWNAKYTAGVKSVTITIDDVVSRATFNCEVLDENME
jgi:archaellum component FlaC